MGSEGVKKQRRKVWFFGGGDPAAAQTKKADWGAIVTGAAACRSPEWTDNPHEWDVMVPHIRVVQNVGLAKATAWSGAIHDLHRRFNYSVFVLDNGAGGGGPFIRGELSNERQVIREEDVKCVPIVTQDDISAIHAHRILCMAKRRDPMIDPHNPGWTNDNQLNDFIYSKAQEMLTAQVPVFLPEVRAFHDRLAGMPDEETWSLKNTEALRKQLGNFHAETNDDGTFVMKSGARVFGSQGRKDIVSAFCYMLFGFWLWLKNGSDDEWEQASEEAPCGDFF